MKKLISVFAVLFFLLCTVSVLAQTPDGMPPSEESVCDVLAVPDATPGLFGLCNAYCEAQDCHLYSAGDLPRSCQQLLVNYYRKKTESDPDMPCNMACPCWGAAELGSVVGEIECTDEAGVVSAEDEDGQLFEVNTDGCFYADGSGGTASDTNLGDVEEEACLADIAFLCPAD